MTDAWPRLRELFDAASELPQEERSAFLESECGEDLKLRREVESLLRHADEGEQAPDPVAGVVREAIELGGTQIGRTISHYEIVERVGAGGMGEVYKAKDTLLERFVAIKVLPAELSDHPERRERFLREARTASSLNHRGIITIHDVVSADGIDHIIMELVDGEPLDRVVPDGGLPLEEALDYAIQTADALAAAHASGVIHRDLKPGNVMVTGHGEVKVLDFGLAKFEETPEPLSSDGTELAPLTRVGTVLGTLEFMSPEQAIGDAVDARSDIFSFGTLLYVMLTGARPFAGKNTASLVHAVVYEAPPVLSEVRDGLPPLIETIVGKALEKKREDRYQTMAEVAAALRRGREGDAAETPTTPASAPASTGLPRARWPGRLWRDHRPALAGSVLLVTALIAVSIPAVRGRLAQLFDTPATVAEKLTPDALLDRGLAALARYDQEGNIDRAIADFQRVLVGNENHAAALAGLARAYWHDGVGGHEDPVRLDQALAVAEQAVTADDLLVMARASRGLIYQELGRLDEAQADFERALQLQPSDDVSLYGLGKVQEARGELDQAAESYRAAIATRPEGWEYYAHLGMLLHRQARYQEAEAVLLDGVAVVPDNAANLRNLGVVHYMQGELAEAAAAFQEALRIEPDPWLYSNLGTLQFAQGLYPQAVSAFEKAIANGGANSYPVWGNLADAYRWVPDSEDEARESYLRALQLLEEKLAAAPQDVTLSSRKALYLAKRGDRERAEQELARVEALEELDASAWFRVAVANEVLRSRDAALSALEKALHAGYSPSDVESDPELMELRQDPRYHRLIARTSAPPAPSGGVS